MGMITDNNPSFGGQLRAARQAKNNFMKNHPRYVEPDIVIIRECKNLPWAIKMKANKILSKHMIDWIEKHCGGNFGVDMRGMENNDGINYVDGDAVPSKHRSWFLRFELEKDAATFKIFWA